MEPQQVGNWETDLSSEEDEENAAGPPGPSLLQGRGDLPHGTILPWAASLTWPWPCAEGRGHVTSPQEDHCTPSWGDGQPSK